MKSSKSKSARRCEFCGEELKRARVNVYRQRGGRHFLFERIPALVCRACGQRIYEADAVETMEHALNQPAPKWRTVRLTIVA